MHISFIGPCDAQADSKRCVPHILLKYINLKRAEKFLARDLTKYKRSGCKHYIAISLLGAPVEYLAIQVTRFHTQNSIPYNPESGSEVISLDIWLFMFLKIKVNEPHKTDKETTDKL